MWGKGQTLRKDDCCASTLVSTCIFVYGCSAMFDAASRVWNHCIASCRTKILETKLIKTNVKDFFLLITHIYYSQPLCRLINWFFPDISSLKISCCCSSTKSLIPFILRKRIQPDKKDLYNIVINITVWIHPVEFIKKPLQKSIPEKMLVEKFRGPKLVNRGLKPIPINIDLYNG